VVGFLLFFLTDFFVSRKYLVPTQSRILVGEEGRGREERWQQCRLTISDAQSRWSSWLIRWFLQLGKHSTGKMSVEESSHAAVRVRASLYLSQFASKESLEEEPYKEGRTRTTGEQETLTLVFSFCVSCVS
jgi:hypothetical protein